MSGLLSTLRSDNASNFSGGLFTLQQQQRVSNTVLYLKKSDQSSAEFDGNGVPKDSKSGRIRAHVPEGLELKSANLKTIYDAEFNGGLNAITPVYLYSSEPEETFVSGYPTYNSTGRVTQKCDGMHVKEKMNDQGRLEFPKEPMTCGMASGAVARLMGKTNNTGDPDISYVKSIKSVTFQEDHVLVVFNNKAKDLKLNIEEFVTAFSLFGKCGLCGTKLEVKLHLTVGVLPTIEPVTFLSHSPYDYYALQNDLMHIEQLYSRVKSLAPDMDLRLSDVELQLYRVPESHRAVIRWSKNKSIIGNMGETELYVSHISLTPEYQEQFAEIIKLESEVKRKRFAMGIQKAKTLVYGGELPVSEPVLQSAEVYQEALPAAAVNDSVVEDVEVLESVPEQSPVSVPVVPEEEVDDIPVDWVVSTPEAPVEEPKTECDVVDVEPEVNDQTTEEIDTSELESDKVVETETPVEYPSVINTDTWNAIISYINRGKDRAFIEKTLEKAKDNLESKYGHTVMDDFEKLLNEAFKETEEEDYDDIPFAPV